MKTVCTIEARMTSSRLPGKGMLLASGKPMLEHMIRRLSRVPQIDQIVIATTVKPQDEPIVELAKRLGVGVYRGSEEDVMIRVIEAAQFFDADRIVQTTGDCPLIDPFVVEQVIDLFAKTKCDFACNVFERCYPDGMDVTVMSLDILKRSYAMTNEERHREHVVLHILENPDLFSIAHLPAPANQNFPDLGLTLDEMGDFLLLKEIIEYFGEQNPYFTCLDVIEFLEKRPELKLLNQEVKRKGSN